MRKFLTEFLQSGWRIQGWRRLAAGMILPLLPGLVLVEPVAGQDAEKARSLVASAIQAMGGEAYLKANLVSSSGRYFTFRKGRKSFAKFWDWTMYEPVKWRFQLGEGKQQFVQVYNLELEKGWTLEGKDTIEEVPVEAIEDFKRTVKTDLDILLKHRLDEEGMELFYYGADDIAGQGEYEAVEFIDSMNNALVVFFNRTTGLPSKIESYFTDDAGVRHKQETEFINWHVFDGVKVALRQDTYVDSEMSGQRFLEQVSINPSVPPEYFLEPVPEKK